jgi:hypothetical protein
LPAGGIAYGQIDHALVALASQLNESSRLETLAGDMS